jgi:hypothetical protein
VIRSFVEQNLLSNVIAHLEPPFSVLLFSLKRLSILIYKASYHTEETVGGLKTALNERKNLRLPFLVEF